MNARSGSPTECCITVSVPVHLRILWVSLGIRLDSSADRGALLKVVNAVHLRILWGSLGTRLDSSADRDALLGVVNAVHLRIVWVSLGIRPDSSADREALLEVVNDVIDVFEADRKSNHVFCHAGVDAFLFGELLMCCRPRVDGKRLCVSDTVWPVSPSVSSDTSDLPYLARFEIILKLSTTC
jgi:hypothetical protein